MSSRTSGLTRSRTSGTMRTRSLPRNSGRSSGTQYAEVLFQGFTGLNNKFSNVELADTESPDCLNVEFDALGAIQKRKGYTLATTMSAGVKSVLPFYTASLNKLLLTYGTSITQYDPIANTSVTVTTTLTGSGARFSSAMDTVHNKVYMVNGNASDGLMSWDGTTFTKNIATTGGMTPQGQFVVWYKNHLYVSGDSSAPNRVYISDQGDPTTWPSLNFIDFDDGMGGITGMSVLGDSIVVFKMNSIYVLKGSDPSNYVVVDAFGGETTGTISHWSIVRVPNGLIFLARDGVYQFDGKKFTLLSLKLDATLWNQANLTNAVAWNYNQKYYLSLPEGTSTTNNYTYVYNYEFGWWTKHSIAANGVGLFYGSTVEPSPYFTDASGHLFELDSGNNDNGGAIDAYFITRAFDFGAPAHKKSFRRMFAFALAEAGNYNLQISMIEDFGLNTKWTQLPLSYPNQTLWGNFNWGQANWGGSGQIAHVTTNVPGMVRYIQFKFEGADKDAPFTFLGLALQYLIRQQVM